MEAAAPALSLSLQVHDIRTGDDIPKAFDAAKKAGAEGVLLTYESMFIVHRAKVTAGAARHNLPAIYPFRLLVTDAGGLMSYDAIPSDLHRQAASYVDRLLNGAKPSELPVQQPARFELSVNLRTTKALGLTIPPTLLARADEVIE